MIKRRDFLKAVTVAMAPLVALQEAAAEPVPKAERIVDLWSDFTFKSASPVALYADASGCEEYPKEPLKRALYYCLQQQGYPMERITVGHVFDYKVTREPGGGFTTVFPTAKLRLPESFVQKLMQDQIANHRDYKVHREQYDIIEYEQLSPDGKVLPSIFADKNYEDVYPFID